MAFVVDGSEWRFDGWSSESLSEALDLFLARVDVTKNRNELLWIGDDFQTRPMIGTLSLWEIFTEQSGVNVSFEIQQELAAWLGRAPRYADEKVWPQGFDDALIAIDGNPPTENQDVAWAHYSVRSGKAVGCFGLKRSGVFDTVTSAGNVKVYWLRDESDQREFWRCAIELEGDNERTLERLAPHAFPDLHFAENLWRGLRDFDGGYNRVRKGLRKCLEVLDDNGAWIFTDTTSALRQDEIVVDEQLATARRPPDQLVERRFAAFGLEMAPEKPNVRADDTSRRAREVNLGRETLYCEWHVKLEPHINRVYIHPPIAESKNRVVIGILASHLHLP